MSAELTFDIQPKPTAVSATKYWIKVQIPPELCELNMRQLTALRKIVTKAYNAGRKGK